MVEALVPVGGFAGRAGIGYKQAGSVAGRAFDRCGTSFLYVEGYHLLRTSASQKKQQSIKRPAGTPGVT